MKANSSLSLRLLPATALALLLAACGGGGDGGGETPDAITPFSFTTVENANAGQMVFSNEVTLAGFKEAQAITVTGGSYCLNLDAENTDAVEICSALPGLVEAGDRLKLMTLASSEDGGEVSMEVRVGNTDDIRFTTSFSIVTRPDTSMPPGEIVVPELKGIDAGQDAITDPVVVDDFEGVLTLSADDASVQFSVDGGAFAGNTVDLRPGQAFALRVPPPADEQPGDARTITLTFTNGEDTRTVDVVVQTRPAGAAGAEPFAFTSADDIELDTPVETSAVIDGQFSDLPVSITGGLYSIGAENNFRAEPGQIHAGETLHVRVVSSNQFDTTNRARVTIGSDSVARTAYFDVTTKTEPEGLNRPDPFSFFKRSLLEPGDVVESAQVEITGFTDTLAVAIDPATPAAAEAQFAVVNEGTVGEFTTTATIAAGQKLVVRAKAPAGFGETHQVRINVGEDATLQTGSFTLATRARDTQAAVFDFGNPPAAEPNEVKIYGSVKISGFDGELPVAVVAPPAADAKFSINGGAFVTSGNITSEQQLRVQVKAPAPGATPHFVRVVVGEGETAVEDTFTVASQDVIPEPFQFAVPTLTLPPGEEADSGEVTFSGFEGDLALNVAVNGNGTVTVHVNDEIVTDFPVMVSDGDTLRLVTNALPQADAQFSVDVSVGSFVGATVTATFTVVTLDVQPDAFSFTPSDVNDANPGEEIVATSDPLNDFVGVLAASVTQNALISFGVVRNGVLVTPVDGANKFVAVGDVIELHIRAPENFDTTVTASVEVGTGVNAASSGLQVTTTDNDAPQLAINFPTRVSTTHGETITLTGSWSDNDHLAELALINNGTTADPVSNHVFPKEEGTWQMTAMLEPGRNDIKVVGIDKSGNGSAGVFVTVMREAPFFTRPQSVAYDQANNRIYVLDQSDPAFSIIEVDLDDNRRRVVATERRGDDGNATEYFEGRLLFGNGKLLLLDTFDAENNKLISVDIGNGDVEEVASGFVDARSLEWGPVIDERRTVYIIGKLASESDLSYAILHVDPAATEPVTVFSHPGGIESRIGSGSEIWNYPSDLAFDAARGLYVIDNADDTLYRIDDDGDRTLVSYAAASTAALDLPRDITFDPANGVLYITNNGVNKPVISVDVSTDGEGTFDLFHSNDGSDFQFGSPGDIVFLTRAGEKFLLVPDSMLSQGIVQLNVTDPAAPTAVIPARNTGEGIPFDSPQTLTLDAANNRLLALSPGGIQGVRISDGDRGSNDLFQMGTGSTLGDVAISGDKLWVTLNGGTTGFGTIEMGDLDDGTSGPGHIVTTILSDNTHFGTSSSLIVEDDKVFVTTRTGTDQVKAVDRNNVDVTTIFDSPTSGFTRKYLFHFDDTRLIGADNLDLYLIGPDDDDDGTLGLVQMIFPADTAVLQNVSGYAYDSDRKRLYMAGRVEDGAATAPLQFGWLDLNPLVTQTEGDLAEADRRFTTIVQTDGANVAMPGYPTAMTQLIGFSLDAEHQRLFALGGTGGSRNEVVAINLMEVAVDEDGQPGFDIVNGKLVRKQTGETVLISRSDDVGRGSN